MYILFNFQKKQKEGLASSIFFHEEDARELFKDRIGAYKYFINAIH